MQLNKLDCEKDLRHVDLVGNVCTLRSPQSPPKWRSSATVGRSPGRRGTCCTAPLSVLSWEEGIAKSLWSPATSKIESDKYKNGWWTSVPSSRLEVVHYSSVGHRQQFRGCRLARSAGTVMRSEMLTLQVRSFALRQWYFCNAQKLADICGQRDLNLGKNICLLVKCKPRFFPSC